MFWHNVRAWALCQFLGEPRGGALGKWASGEESFVQSAHGSEDDERPVPSIVVLLIGRRRFARRLTPASNQSFESIVYCFRDASAQSRDARRRAPARIGGLVGYQRGVGGRGHADRRGYPGLLGPWKENCVVGGIGHSSCILAQRPSMGVMLNP